MLVASILGLVALTAYGAALAPGFRTNKHRSAPTSILLAAVFSQAAGVVVALSAGAAGAVGALPAWMITGALVGLAAVGAARLAPKSSELWTALAAVGAAGAASLCVSTAGPEFELAVPGAQIGLMLIVAVAAAVALASGAIASRRLLGQSHTRLLVWVALGSVAVASLTSVWSGGWASMPLRVEAEGVPAVVEAILRAQDLETGVARLMTVRAPLPGWFDIAATFALWSTVAAVLLSITQATVPGGVFRLAALASLGTSAFSWILLALAALWVCLIGVSVELTPEAFARSLDILAAHGSVPPGRVAAVAGWPAAELRIGATAAPASFSLIWLVAVAVVATARFRMRELLSLEEDDGATGWQTATEVAYPSATLVTFTLGAWAVALVAQLGWMEWLQGSGYFWEPRIYLTLGVLGTLMAAIVARESTDDGSAWPDWMVLMAAILAVAVLFGPALGWTPPSALLG